jgi:hypothetical protein
MKTALLICASLPFAVLLSLQTPSRVPAPQKLWESTYPGRVLSLAIAPGGTCVAALTETTAEVRNEAGRPVWASPIVGDKQDIGFGRIAVSPQCDWTAVFLSRNTRPPLLQIFARNGARVSISLDSMVGLDPNASTVSSLAISPDGKLLAVGFEAGRLWIVTKSGGLQNRFGPLEAPQIDAEFAPDSRRLIMKGWFASGLMRLDGQWDFRTPARNFSASRNLSLFATLTAPMHGPQSGDIAILDSAGKVLWKEMAWNASMAIAPDASFVVFATTAARSQRSTGSASTPDLGGTPDIRVRDKTGKVVSQRAFDGAVVGVSSDSKCILLHQTSNQDLIAVNRQLVETWRLRNAREPRHQGTLIMELDGNTIRASRMPGCP